MSDRNFIYFDPKFDGMLDTLKREYGRHFRITRAMLNIETRMAAGDTEFELSVCLILESERADQPVEYNMMDMRRAFQDAAKAGLGNWVEVDSSAALRGAAA